ncbi:hypothetical protein GGX14DRAFT_692431 [Mycena pura]|uniref:Uncharacterized protein n=1 Tax=Mycena pura TaxID=153505 RepID=A0AAD6YT27_9AGAR|nr:hypothetical protein GGX14DRAFT_692431 [Mycena pura]
MSTASLLPLRPSYSRTPSYSVEPGIYEQRLALNNRRLPQRTGNFTKSSKNGDATLRLTAQEDKIELPVYGSGGVVEGIVELAKTEHVSNVEVKVEGRLQLQEVGEGGHSTTKLRLDTLLLWIRDANNSVCPPSLRFAMKLPTTFEHKGHTYPLPPSHSVKLEGVPGFYATIDYSVSAIINKPHSVPNIVPLVKSKKLGINIGSTVVSTPFIYYPRTRPAVPLPSPLPRTEGGFVDSPEWKVHQSVLKANGRGGVQDINVKLYLPGAVWSSLYFHSLIFTASRIFCASRTIPFHVTFESSALSLAAFLPFGPTGSAGKRRATRMQLMRQSTIDVRGTSLQGVKTDIWRHDCIGEGTFRHAGDGATWISFSGEIAIEPIKVVGFKIAGLAVQDCLLFTVTPPDVTKTPFIGIREMVPVRLATDAYIEDGRGLGAVRTSPEDPPDSFSRALTPYRPDWPSRSDQKAEVEGRDEKNPVQARLVRGSAGAYGSAGQMCSGCMRQSPRSSENGADNTTTTYVLGSYADGIVVYAPMFVFCRHTLNFQKTLE